MSNEKRHFFRISDNIGFAFRLARTQEPDPKQATDPKIAKAVGQLNRKIDLLFGITQGADLSADEQYEYNYQNFSVNLSARYPDSNSRSAVDFYICIQT